MNYELKDIDTEDIEDLLFKVEKSFGIKFGEAELVHITNFGELCDYIVNKIQLDHSNDCTTQQAFYKFRDAISSKFEIDKKSISTDFLLIDLFPRQNRRKMTAELEKHLGFKLNILRPPHWETTILSISLLVSFVGLFFYWKIGVSGLILSIIGLWLSNKTGEELKVQTVGQVAEKMTRENYLKSRRNPKTFNKEEIEKVLTDWFCNDLGLDKNKLNRDAKLAKER